MFLRLLECDGSRMKNKAGEISRNELVDSSLMLISVLKKNDKIEPNPNDLLTLERNGIDVSFLSAFDPTLDIADSAEVAECLAQLAVLVPQLAKLQDARLVAPNRPPELMPQFCVGKNYKLKKI